MSWWVIAALIVAGSVAWAFTTFKGASEERKANGRRSRKVADVAREACRPGKFLSNRPVRPEDPHQVIDDVDFHIDRG